VVPPKNCSIDVLPHGESKGNGIVFVCSSDLKPQKDFNLAMALRWAALTGNASLIATFSGLFQSSDV